MSAKHLHLELVTPDKNGNIVCESNTTYALVCGEIYRVIPPPKTVKDILIAAITAAGGDGLCCDGCGCEIDNLVPYECSPLNCIIAKRIDPVTCTPETCQYQLRSDCYSYACMEPLKEADK